MGDRNNIFEEPKVLVAESVDAYNWPRPYLSLGMKTLEEVHENARYEVQQAQTKPVNKLSGGTMHTKSNRP